MSFIGSPRLHCVLHTALKNAVDNLEWVSIKLTTQQQLVIYTVIRGQHHEVVGPKVCEKVGCLQLKKCNPERRICRWRVGDKYTAHPKLFFFFFFDNEYFSRYFFTRAGGSYRLSNWFKRK